MQQKPELFFWTHLNGSIRGLGFHVLGRRGKNTPSIFSTGSFRRNYYNLINYFFHFFFLSFSFCGRWKRRNRKKKHVIYVITHVKIFIHTLTRTHISTLEAPIYIMERECNKRNRCLETEKFSSFFLII